MGHHETLVMVEMLEDGSEQVPENAKTQNGRAVRVWPWEMTLEAQARGSFFFLFDDCCVAASVQAAIS